MGAGCCPPWSYNRQKRNWITGTAYSYRRTNTYDMTHRKRQNWSVPHPNRLNRFPSEQRTRRCYIEKDKTDPFHIPTDWIGNQNGLHTRPHPSNFYDSFENPSTPRCYHVTKGSTEFMPTLPKRLNWSTSQKKRLSTPEPCPKDWIGSHYKRKDWIHTNHAQKAELVHIAKGKTAFLSTMPKDWIHTNHAQKTELVHVAKGKTAFLSTMPKDWIGSRHKRKDWMHSNHAQKTELFHITKGKIQFTPTTPKRLNWFTSPILTHTTKKTNFGGLA